MEDPGVCKPLSQLCSSPASQPASQPASHSVYKPAGNCYILPSWSTQETVLARASPEWAPLHRTSLRLWLSSYPPPIFVSLIAITSLPLKALSQSVKRPCSAFPDLFKSRNENYPHSPTPMCHSSAPSSNLHPLHSQPPPQEPGAEMRAGGCLWSSAGLQTHMDKGERTGERCCQCPRIPVCAKAMLVCVPTCTSHLDTVKGLNPPPSPSPQSSVLFLTWCEDCQASWGLNLA